LFNAAIGYLALHVSELRGKSVRQLICGRLSFSNRGNEFFSTVMPDDEASLGICATPISEHVYSTTTDLAAYLSSFGVTVDVEKLGKQGICVAEITNESASRMGF